MMLLSIKSSIKPSRDYLGCTVVIIVPAGNYKTSQDYVFSVNWKINIS